MCSPPSRACFLSELICLENFVKASVQLVECLAGQDNFRFGSHFYIISLTVENGEIPLSTTDVLLRELFSGENLGCWQCV